MRLWKDHHIKPVEFAASFRKKPGISKKQWPHLELDYGPQTLMQGWVELDAETFSAEARQLIGRFVSIHGILDEMLAERKCR